MAELLTMDPLIERFTTWAGQRADVRALAVVGSRARVERPADQWSDLDLALFVDDPQPYLAQGGWLDEIAPPVLTFLEPTAIGGQVERRVLFAGALDVDISPLPGALLNQWRADGLPEAVARVLGRGVRVLFDRDGLLTEALGKLPPASPQRHDPPSVAAFDQVVNDFLYHAVWGAKKLRRGEVWMAKQNCDCYLKRLLRQMIAWHAQAANGWQLDTWHEGRFLDQWATPEARATLPATFAAYDPADITRALLTTVDLFATLARPVAAAIGAHYPEEAHRAVVRWIR